VKILHIMAFIDSQDWS